MDLPFIMRALYLHHRSIRVPNLGFYFWDPPRALGGSPTCRRSLVQIWRSKIIRLSPPSAPPDVPSVRASGTPLDDISGLLMGSWGVLATAPIRTIAKCRKL